MILQPFFKTVETASKNARSKHGDVEAANKSIDFALLGMINWIDWQEQLEGRFR